MISSLTQPLLTLAASGAEHAASPTPLTPAEEFAQDALFLVVDASIVTLAMAFLMCLWRLTKGPTLVDRGLAADTMSLQVVGLVILLTIRLRTLLFFDAVLIVSILGFVSTVAFAQFIGRRRRV